MKKSKKSLWRKASMLILIVLVAALVTGVAIMQFSDKNTISSNVPAINELLTSIRGEKIAEAKGKQCESGGINRNCHQMNIIVFSVKTPGFDTYDVITRNLTRAGWQREDKSNFTKIDVDAVRERYKDKKITDNQISNVYFSLITGLSGSHKYLIRGSKVAAIAPFYNESFSDRSESDGLSILRSEIADEFTSTPLDYKKDFIDYLKANPGKMIIALSVEE